MALLRLLAVLFVLAVLLGIPSPSQAAYPTVTVKLDPLNNSGQSGTAVLSDLGNDQTKVVITITGEPTGASEPVHIHNGQCGPTLGSVAFPLTNVVNGTSETTVNKGLDDLSSGQFAINGHKSSAELSVYVFCGNIPAVPQTTATTGGAPGNPVSLYLALLLGGAALVTGGALLRRRLP
jgi:hypothetical protein